MGNYHLIRSVFGGSDVYDDSGRQVGYSLLSVLGGTEGVDLSKLMEYVGQAE